MDVTKATDCTTKYKCSIIPIYRHHMLELAARQFGSAPRGKGSAEPIRSRRGSATIESSLTGLPGINGPYSSTTIAFQHNKCSRTSWPGEEQYPSRLLEVAVGDLVM